MKWLSRSAVIAKTFYRYGLSDIIVPHVRPLWLQKLLRALQAP